MSGARPVSTCRREGLALALWILAAGGCGEPTVQVDVPMPETAEMEPQVAARLRETRAMVLAEPDSAAAWGRFGMVAHAHELLDEAATAYRQAESLDPVDPRWPYYLGDVLSIEGTDLAGAEAAFRRAMEDRADYAPAHLRLGRVLVAAGQPAAARVEFTRALELESDLQPARVALAQLELADGDAERAARLLEVVLGTAPRHEQALATLGRAYMRLGRRDAAREVAERAREPAAYNLYSDPLMSQVVAEGVSSVLIWERAKAFLESGNDEQAALGLRQVVALQPDNADAHHQLATALGNLGRIGAARTHLERALELEPEAVAPRLQLAMVLLEQGHAAAAVVELERVGQEDPDTEDLGWLLGRARLAAEDTVGAVDAFERAAAGSGPVPGWAHGEWGRALARLGRAEAALKHFAAVLALDPDDPAALFYSGLVHEGRGEIARAVSYYCHSLDSARESPAAARLQALGRSCP